MRLRLALAGVCVLLTACGHASATAPSATGGGVHLQAGRYTVALTGPNDRCGNVLEPDFRTDASFVITMRADGSRWTGATSTGGLSMTFQLPALTGSIVIGPVPFSGTASGFADDEAVVAPPDVGIKPVARE